MHDILLFGVGHNNQIINWVIVKNLFTGMEMIVGLIVSEAKRVDYLVATSRGIIDSISIHLRAEERYDISYGNLCYIHRLPPWQLPRAALLCYDTGRETTSDPFERDNCIKIWTLKNYIH